MPSGRSNHYITATCLRTNFLLLLSLWVEVRFLISWQPLLIVSNTCIDCKWMSVFFFRIFSHFYIGSIMFMRRIHWTRSCAPSPDNSLSDKSFLMLSNHLLFGLPLLRCPGTSITITLAHVLFFSSQYMPIPLQSSMTVCILICKHFSQNRNGICWTLYWYGQLVLHKPLVV